MIETKVLIADTEMFACYNGSVYLTPHFYDNVECDYFQTPILNEAAFFPTADAAQDFLNTFHNYVQSDVDIAAFYVVKVQAIVTKL